MIDAGKLKDYEEVCPTTYVSKWQLAIKDEVNSLIFNQTQELAKLPSKKKAFHNKWVYRVKKEYDVSKWQKCRVVVKEIQQKEGIDYVEFFVPVVKHNTIRFELSIIASEDLQRKKGHEDCISSWRFS